MGVGSHLSHRCRIERPTYALDEYGARVASWATIAEGVPCRLVQDVIRAPEGVLAERPTITQTRLIVGPRTDLRQDDRVAGVTYEDGTQDEGVYVVRTLVARRRGTHGIAHRTAEVEKAGGV